MLKVSKYILGDLVKNRVLVGYTLLLACIGWGTFLLESQPEKALLILMQVTLFALPLIAMVFSTVYYYNSLEFIMLILGQPVSRAKVIGGFYLGLCTSLVLSFLVGVCVPLLVYYPGTESVSLILGGTLLTIIFTALALLVGTSVADKAKGMGVTLLTWVIFAILYDGILLLLMYQFGDYPIEKGVLVLSFLNPIDIARILIIMKTESAAMLGLSGAIFREFFGSTLGLFISLVALVIWSGLPFLFARRKFIKKDL